MDTEQQKLTQIHKNLQCHNNDGFMLTGLAMFWIPLGLLMILGFTLLNIATLSDQRIADQYTAAIAQTLASDTYQCQFTYEGLYGLCAGEIDSSVTNGIINNQGNANNQIPQLSTIAQSVECPYGNYCNVAFPQAQLVHISASAYQLVGISNNQQQQQPVISPASFSDQYQEVCIRASWEFHNAFWPFFGAQPYKVISYKCAFATGSIFQGQTGGEATYPGGVIAPSP
jgi:hypothetical protein